MFALFVGLAFGMTGYHIFLLPYFVHRAAKLGIIVAAKELRGWLSSLEPDFRGEVEWSMQSYNFDRLVARLEQVEASSVAPDAKK